MPLKRVEKRDKKEVNTGMENYLKNTYNVISERTKVKKEMGITRISQQLQHLFRL